MRIKEMHEAERKEAEGMEPERQKRRQQCVQLSKTHDHLFNQVTLWFLRFEAKPKESL